MPLPAPSLYVNTISFNGKKACINSYSIGYVDRNEGGLGDAMRKQAAVFAAKFPNAIVKTEAMTDAETVALVQASGGHDRQNTVWAIGMESEGAN